MASFMKQSKRRRKRGSRRRVKRIIKVDPLILALLACVATFAVFNFCLFIPTDTFDDKANFTKFTPNMMMGHHPNKAGHSVAKWSWTSLFPFQSKARRPIPNNKPCPEAVKAYTVPKHGCYSSKDGYYYPLLCGFENFRVDVEKIDSALGGEILETVMGRSESVEFPKYTQGAFSLDRTPNPMPSDLAASEVKNSHYIADVLLALDYPSSPATTAARGGDQPQHDCVEHWPGTTLFITRYEYINLFHTISDIWNAFFVMPAQEITLNVIFLDAHAQGILDPIWQVLFGKYTFVKHLPKGGVCFEKAILVPSGYESPLFLRDDTLPCGHEVMAESFSSYIFDSYGLSDVRSIPGKVSIIERIPFIAHPRSKQGTASRTISNLHELQSRVKDVPGVTSVETIFLERMSFKEQLRKIRETDMLIGNHGAGLTHALFMDTGGKVVELTRYGPSFFKVLSHLRGVFHEYYGYGTVATKLTEHELIGVVRRITEIISGGDGVEQG